MDASTFANNLVGVILGFLQLFLIWYYPTPIRQPNPGSNSNLLASVKPSTALSKTTVRSDDDDDKHSGDGISPEEVVPLVEPVKTVSVTHQNGIVSRIGASASVFDDR
jgi:hypothetical protein